VGAEPPRDNHIIYSSLPTAELTYTQSFLGICLQNNCQNQSLFAEVVIKNLGVF